MFLCRGRHASKLTEEEEDAEYLKEEEAGAGSTRLVAQPSCKIILSLPPILSSFSFLCLTMLALVVISNFYPGGMTHFLLHLSGRYTGKDEGLPTCWFKLAHKDL